MKKGKASPDERRVRGLTRALEVGERVFLRRPTERDRTEYVALRRESRAFLEPWEPRSTDGHDMFGANAYDTLLAFNRKGQSLKLLVCRGDDGRIVGQVSLNMIMRGAFQSCFLGYWIGAAYTRQGYSCEAVGLAVRHALESLDLHRVEANIMPRNRPSKGLIRKCGFRFEGLARRYLQIAGRWEDHEHWTMTREDWDARSRRRKRRS